MLTYAWISFSSRNHISNTINNFIDLGPGGALSYKTNVMASLISSVGPVIHKYGSIDEALRVMSSAEYIKGLPSYMRQGEALPKPIRATVGAVGGDLPHIALQANIKLWGGLLGRNIMKDGIDLGDRVVRSLDDAVKLMTENGVLSVSRANLAEEGASSTRLLRLALEDPANITGKAAAGLDLIKKSKGVARDSVFIFAPHYLTGGASVPISFGVHIGSIVSKGVENWARSVNFIGNLRRGGTWTEALAHTEKYLFNYNDLTGLQRKVIRHLVPFWIWRSKNVRLQLRLMYEKPYVHAALNEFLGHSVPNITEAIIADRAGVEYRPPDSGLDYLMGKGEYEMPWYQPPLPGQRSPGRSRVKYRRTNVPIESAWEDLGYLSDFLGGLKRLGAGSVPFVSSQEGIRRQAMGRAFEDKKIMRSVSQLMPMPVRTLSGYLLKHDMYFNKPIDEITNAKRLTPLVTLVSQIGNDLGQHEWGPMLRYRLGYTEVYDPMGDRVMAFSDSIYGLGNQPFSRFLNELAAGSDMTYSSVLNDPAVMEQSGLGAIAEEYPLISPYTIRLFQAMSGFKLFNYDPEVGRYWNEQDMAEAYKRWAEIHNIFGSRTEHYVRER